MAAREKASFAFGLLTHSNVDCRWIFLRIFAKIVYLPLEMYRLPHFLLSSSRNVKDWQSVIRNGLWMVVHAAVFLEHLAWINLNDMKRCFRIFYLFYSFSYWQQANSNDDRQKTSKEQATTTTKKTMSKCLHCRSVVFHLSQCLCRGAYWMVLTLNLSGSQLSAFSQLFDDIDKMAHRSQEEVGEEAVRKCNIYDVNQNEFFCTRNSQMRMPHADGYR